MELDIQSLLALDAARTPGKVRYERVTRLIPDEPEWLVIADELSEVSLEIEAVAIAMFYDEKDAASFVAAVNAIGPLCRRVEMLEAQLIDHGIKPQEGCE